MRRRRRTVIWPLKGELRSFHGRLFCKLLHVVIDTDVPTVSGSPSMGIWVVS
jgi:hypothetical protein